MNLYTPTHENNSSKIINLIMRDIKCIRIHNTHRILTSKRIYTTHYMTHIIIHSMFYVHSGYTPQYILYTIYK